MLKATIDDDVLNIAVKAPATPADWDMAKALIKRIQDPAHWLPTSALAAVDWFSISVA